MCAKVSRLARNDKHLRFFGVFLARYLKTAYLCTCKRANPVLGYGVMVTLQILVLPFLVRVRVAQHTTFCFSPRVPQVVPDAFGKYSLGYGVMVTLQILVLPFLVRVRVAQQKKTDEKCFISLFLLFLQRKTQKKNT